MNEKDILDKQGYNLIEKIVKDGWGTLYKSLYVPLGLQVLVRVFNENLSSSDDAWTLMMAEIQAWARLRHPRIIQVLDWGREEGASFLVTELPKGAPLFVSANSLGDEETREKCFLEVMEAVEAARRWGVIHLGLGRSNIWIESNGDAQVGDFGFFYVSREFPKVGECDDTFLSPEQKDEAWRVGPSTDVYSLGLLYAWMFFGEKESQRMADGSFEIAQSSSRLPVLMRALDPSPLARYKTAGELKEAMGFDLGQPAEDTYRDCPLCRLKAQIAREQLEKEPMWEKRTNFAFWVAVGVLAALTIIVWLIALS
ncbi:MAG: protein kinase [Actinomycetota bacterium]|nr:protein kinase [Actinomycetota bacterium]